MNLLESKGLIKALGHPFVLIIALSGSIVLTAISNVACREALIGSTLNDPSKSINSLKECRSTEKAGRFLRAFWNDYKRRIIRR
jgi:hypothetical protein